MDSCSLLYTDATEVREKHVSVMNDQGSWPTWHTSHKLSRNAKAASASATGSLFFGTSIPMYTAMASIKDIRFVIASSMGTKSAGTVPSSAVRALAADMASGHGSERAQTLTQECRFR